MDLAVDQVLAGIGRRKINTEEIEDMILDSNWNVKEVIETICREIKEPQKKKKKPTAGDDVGTKPSVSTTTSEKSGGVTVTQSKFFFFFLFFVISPSPIIASPPENTNQLFQQSTLSKLQ